MQNSTRLFYITKNYWGILFFARHKVIIEIDQGWWKNINSLIDRCGCGLIAMCNTELYLTMNNQKYSVDKDDVVVSNGSIKFESKLSNIELMSAKADKGYKYDYYKEYVEKSTVSGGRYEITDFPLDRFDGLLPKKMSSGLMTYFNNNHYGNNVYWAKSNNKALTQKHIIENIDNDIPVVASYNNTMSRTNYSSNSRKNLLPYYKNCNRSEEPVGGMASHYFVITGVYKNIMI